MGCDIHMWAQYGFVGKDGKTIRYSGSYKIHIDRNYHLFAALANVRNGTWGMEVKPISDPRGFPEMPDYEEARKDHEEWNGDAHTESWLTVKELKEWKGWDQKVPHKAVVDTTEDGIEKWLHGRKTKAPPSFADAMLGFPEGRVKSVRWTDHLRDHVKKFLDVVLPYIEETVGKDGRIVFWFDN